jgi:hypothetical protein
MAAKLINIIMNDGSRHFGDLPESIDGQRFSVNNQFGEYWFFVDNPRCSEEILEAVLGHCELVLVSA